MCGFKAHKHEGKITGLAAHGEPKYVPLLREFIEEEDGTFINRGGVHGRHPRTRTPSTQRLGERRPVGQHPAAFGRAGATVREPLGVKNRAA
jgi:predicted NodU family carbamoyl transferase